MEDSMEVGLQTLAFEDATSKFEEFFRRYYSKDILKVARGFPEERSLYVDFDDLDRYDIALADNVLNNPDFAIPAAAATLQGFHQDPDTPPLKLNPRFHNLPDTHRFMIRDLRSEDVGKLIWVDGIVRKSTDVRPKLVEGAFECQRCGNIMRIPQDGETLKEPYLCESCEKKGPFKLLVDESRFIDNQKIQVQELLETLRGGEHPKQLTITLEDDLTGKITPGDQIVITGILRAIRKKVGTKSLRIFEIFIDGNSYQRVQTDFEDVTVSPEDKARIMELSKNPKIYDLIQESIAPHIFGHSDIKRAIMYQLFSAPALHLPNGGTVRGDSHIIIMGEPATGKSEILQYVAKELAPRGIYTSGKGSSSAGLTATAVKDEFGDGGWSLEAGALVLADRGIACIDEFDKMEKTDRSAMHEAMEQQTVSVAKAGILATFQSRCSILAAANPKYGRFDDYRPISEQVNLPPTILSRFDLIFFVRDELENTNKIAQHILNTAIDPEAISPSIDADLLRKYVAYSRGNILPIMDKAAQERIESFYVEIRELAQHAEDVPIPLTARQLWAIIRLARACARVRLSKIATLEDAERAIDLVKLSLSQAGLDMESGQFDIDKIMVGVTKTQRDKITEILDIIRNLEKEFGDAKKDEVFSLAKERGIDRKNAEEQIERLLRDSNIYEPRHGRYKIV
jgi:replicative DNA helicase Mcm